MLIKNSIIKKIIQKYEKIWSLNYLNSIVGWDTETYMPNAGILARSKVLSNLSSLVQDLYLDSELLNLLDEVRGLSSLNIYERKIIHVLDKQIEIFQKLPKKFVMEFSDLIAGASTTWALAKEKNDLGIFLPSLDKIFDKTRQKADFLGYKNEPYEAIFEQYEEDFSIKDLDSYFDELKKFLEKIDLKNVEFKYSKDFKKVDYNKKNMKDLNSKVLDFFGEDRSNFRIDVSSHPFSIFMSLGDIRLTTNYQKFDFTSSFFPTIHEFGHGLYASQSNTELEYTPLWPETSYVLHESQSRFWENMIGKSRNFIEVFINDFRELSPQFKNYSVEDFYQNFNAVEPSLIRTQADEITYHFHILIRYEIEKALLNNEIKVSEVNELWNSKYKQYLGIIPANYSDGLLQDIHWSFGSIGYFPTYSLGSALSAIWLESVEKDLQWNKIKNLTKGNIDELKIWLKNNIHQYAGTYTFNEMTLKVSDKDFSIKPWEKYIKAKYKLNFDI